MGSARVDRGVLKDTIAKTNEGLAQVRSILSALLVTDLSDTERAETLRAPNDALEAERDIALASVQFPDLVAATGYEADVVLECLDNLVQLVGLTEQLEAIKKWVEDSKLVWGAEAYQQSLELYRVAKPLARKDGSLRELVDPLEKVFLARRRRKVS